MKLSVFLDAMEQLAPAALAEEFDNVGLLVGTRKQEIRRVLVALECTGAVAREAAEWGADLVLTHHPMFISPVKCILPDEPQTLAAYTLIEHGIGFFAAHTNLDAADGGVNDVMCGVLGLKNVRKTKDNALMRLGELEMPMTLSAFSALCEKVFQTDAMVCGDQTRLVSTVAVTGGSGGDGACHAHALGADVFVSGEVKHHAALTAQELGIAVVTLGHYASEAVVLESLISRLQPFDFDVQYMISRTGCAPFARPEGGAHE